MKNTFFQILCLVVGLALLAACSTRDLDHVSGNMSNDPRLVELQNYYSPFDKRTYGRSLEMVNAIDPATLPLRDRYEWLELKCNIARACDTLVTWMDDIRQWVDYADTNGSDRDILAAHLALSRAYLNQDYKWRYTKFMTIEESDSLMNLHWQELLFCVHYKEDDTLSLAKGDFLLLKAETFYLMAEEFRRSRRVDYMQIARYKHQAAKLFDVYRKNNPSQRLGRWSDWHRALLLDAAVCYRNSNEFKLALDCAFDALALASQDDNKSDLCLARALLANISNAQMTNGAERVWFSSDSEKYYRGRQAEDLNLLNQSLAEYSKNFNFPEDLLYHYKSLIFFSCGDVDSAYHYSQMVWFPLAHPVKNHRANYAATYQTTLENYHQMLKENCSIAAHYARNHGDIKGAANNFNQAYYMSEQLRLRQTRHNVMLQENVARAEIRRIEERQREENFRQVVFFLLLIVLILSSVAWLLTRKQRKMRRMHSDIEALNRQLDQMRADQLQQQVTLDSRQQLPLRENGMEAVFVRKLQMKRTAFADTEHHRAIVQYALRSAASCNPDTVTLSATERHRLMDAILGDFSLECQQLREICPDLTGADAVYCILNLLGCDRELGAALMEVSQEAYRRRKSRIKAKMSEPLFASIFAADSSDGNTNDTFIQPQNTTIDMNTKLKKLTLIAALFAVCGASAIGQENRPDRAILQRAVDNIARMEPLQEYTVAHKSWYNWEDEPDVYKYTMKWLVLSVPDEPYTQSKYVRWDDNGFCFGYDGEKRIRPRNDGKDSLYEIDYKFKHAEAPRIRVVPKPFFQTASEIIRYVLNSPDSMIVNWVETPTYYELQLTTQADQCMTFTCGHLDPHGVSRKKLARIIPADFHEWFNVRLSKADLLPCELIAAENPQSVHRETVLSRKALADNALDIVSFLPDGYRIYDPAADSRKPLPSVSIGQPLPDFTAVDTEGKTHGKADYHGKTLLLVHTAILCGACQAAEPTLDSLFAVLPHDKVEILALSAWRESLDNMRSYRNQKGFAYPYALSPQSDEMLQRLGGSSAAPQFTLVDAQGIVRQHLVGFNKEKLLQWVKSTE